MSVACVVSLQLYKAGSHQWQGRADAPRTLTNAGLKGRPQVHRTQTANSKLQPCNQLREALALGAKAHCGEPTGDLRCRQAP